MTYRNDIITVAALPLPWEKLSDCNILITGATGLIGCCLVEVLMKHPQRDYDVYAMGRNKQRMTKLFERYLSDERFHVILSDVTEPLATDQSFHYIIHAASGAAPSDFSQHPVEVMKANFLGVANMMEYGIKHNIRRFLYVSSGEVYGEGDGREFSEEYSGYVDCTIPRSCYPSSKRASETLCVSYVAEYGVDVVIARPCHVYGPNFTENDNRVYAQFIRNVLRDEDIVMKSTGGQFRSWCYVVDCVSALLYILLKGENGQAYNIANKSSNISIRDLAEIVAATKGKEVVISVPNVNEKQGFNVVTKSVFSTKKIEKLGWLPRVNMQEGIRKTIEEICNKSAFK